MPQTYAQEGNFRPQHFYGLDQDSRVLRPAGAGGEDDFLRSQGLDLRNGHLVVADDPDIRLNGANELIEVVGKAVVIIDEQDHKSASFCARSRASTTARALFTRS